jgi:hypothetical protein
MGIHITKYKTENGKTRKAKSAAAKPAGGGAQGAAGADNKTAKPENPAKQGA